MEQTETQARRFGWRLAAAALAPFVVQSAYLFCTRWPSARFTTFTDYAGFAISLLAGAVFLGTVPIHPPYRVPSLVCYIPLVAALLFFYTFWFIAVVFHDAL